MLTAKDVGKGYVPGDDEITTYVARVPGCLSALWSLTASTDADVKVVRSYRGKETEPMSVVSTQVASFPKTATAERAFTSFRNAVTGCTAVTKTQSKGSFQFKVATDDGPGDQVNVRALGSMLSGTDGGFPIAMWISVVQVRNHLAIVRLTEVRDAADPEGKATTARVADLATTARERLEGVAS